MTPNNLKSHRILPLGHYKVFSDEPSSEVIRVKQVHSADLINLNNSNVTSKIECDGIIFDLDKVVGKSIAITTADCMPILFLGPKKGVFLHAGWRGLAKGIHLHDEIKKITPTYCLIGPSIKVQSFEVQEDFKTYFSDTEFFKESGDKLFFDLAAKAKKDIIKAYDNILLEVVDECTFEHDKYHSYRRDKTKQRNWNIFHL